MATAKVLSNLVGSSYRDKFPALKGAELSVNLYPGKNGKNTYMESLPGLQLLENVGGKCRGCYVSTIGLEETHSTEDMFAVMGNVLYRFDLNGNKTKIGNVANNGNRISFAETGGPRALLLIADGANLFYYNLLEGGGLHPIQLPERITERGGTINPTFVSVVEGCIVVNDAGSGYVYYSPISYPLASDTREMYQMDGDSPVYDEDGVTVLKETVPSDEHVFENDYHVQQYESPYSSSDSVNAIYSCQNLLYVFGPKSCEIWQRDTSENGGWIRVSYSVQSSFGLEAPYSVASCGNTLYFVASGAQYGKCVMAATGTQFKKISEDWLDEKLLSESTDSAYAYCYSVGEHQFWVLQMNSLAQTWAFDALDSGWHQRISRDSRSGAEIQWRASAVAYFHEKFYAFTSDGCKCGFHRDYWYEDFPDGTRLPMIRHRISPVITSDLKPFVIEYLSVECNVGTWDDYTLKPMMLLEVSHDGTNTWSNVRSASLGRTGDYAHRVQWFNLGYGRLQAIRLTYSHPTDLVLTFASVRAESTGAMA